MMSFAFAINKGAAGAGTKIESYGAETGRKTLLDAEPGQTYIIKEINTEDDDMNSFLFRLGCYAGEQITLISKKKKSCIVVIKDGRYNLDKMLSEAIII
jgi:ferrous iron transport protein A